MVLAQKNVPSLRFRKPSFSIRPCVEAKSSSFLGMPLVRASEV